MKTVPTQVRDHLDKETTALCTCWIITRMDGKVLRFTDADVDVIRDGKTYKSIGAYRRTAIENTSTLAVDNLDIVGSAEDLALPEEELRSGLFDNAEITVFMTPWMDSVPGIVKLRKGFFGEVQVLPNNTYKVELRGLMQRLNYTYTSIFSATCLYDLGEKKCGINIKGKDVAPGVYFASGEGARIAQDTYKVGKFYPIGWKDPDFEEAGRLGDINKSLYWTNSGAFDLEVVSDSAYSGNYSLRGGGGDGLIYQDIDILEASELPIEDVDSERCYLTMRGFRSDVGAQGKMSVDFLDKDGNVLGYGQQLDVGADTYTLGTTLSFAGDFTVELLLKHEAEPSIDQAIFTAGTFSIAGTGVRLAYDGGRLTLSIDDNASIAVPPTTIVSDKTAEEGVWYHVALVRSGTEIRMYENMELVATDTYAGSIDIENFGNGPDSSGFVGKWDELRVWSVMRSQADLGLNNRVTIDPASAGLERYFSFNDATGADLTGNDTLEFGAANIVTAAGSPVGVKAADAAVRGSASYTTGFQDVGALWTEVGFQDHLIPAATKRVRFEFAVNQVAAVPVMSRLDNLNGHIINTGEEGIIVGYMTNDVAWRCVTAGVTDGYTAAGGVGDTVTIGGAQFIGEDAWLRGGRVLKVINSRTFICDVNDPRAVDAWFAEGTVLFETGANSGAGMEVKRWDAANKEIELFLSMPHQLAVGDHFSVYPGCDKSRVCCAAIFNNVKNMFATPDVPGQDDLYRYPEAN